MLSSLDIPTEYSESREYIQVNFKCCRTCVVARGGIQSTLRRVSSRSTISINRLDTRPIPRKPFPSPGKQLVSHRPLILVIEHLVKKRVKIIDRFATAPSATSLVPVHGRNTCRLPNRNRIIHRRVELRGLTSAIYLQ